MPSLPRNPPRLPRPKWKATPRRPPATKAPPCGICSRGRSLPLPRPWTSRPCSPRTPAMSGTANTPAPPSPPPRRKRWRCCAVPWRTPPKRTTPAPPARSTAKSATPWNLSCTKRSAHPLRPGIPPGSLRASRSPRPTPRALPSSWAFLRPAATPSSFWQPTMPCVPAASRSPNPRHPSPPRHRSRRRSLRRLPPNPPM